MWLFQQYQGLCRWLAFFVDDMLLFIMLNLLFVFIGSGLGGATRFCIYQLMSHFNQHSWIATLLCNMIGSFVISVIISYFLSLSDYPKHIYALLIIGYLGGFTTFSTFSLDAIKLYQDNIAMMTVYIIISVFGSLMMCGLGFYVGRIIFGRF
ncbi:MAG: CrcB protein [Alphaproteobacteria bacterium]